MGIELITLEKITSISFNKNLDLHDSRKFQRHHIFLNDKDSIDPNRLVLAVLTTHTSLEGLSELINSLLKDRTSESDSCPLYYQNNLKDAKNLWNEYLKRRYDMKYKSIEFFFRTYYPDVVNRFYLHVPKGQLETKIKQIIEEWIKDGNPVPKLPKYLQNRLFK